MKRAVIITFVLGMLPPQLVLAQGRSDKDWQNNVFVYGLATAITGDTQFGPIENPVDVSFGDILDKLEGGFMGRYRGSNERFAIVADFIYLSLGHDAETGLVRRAELDQLVVDLTGAYFFSPIAEALFGVRITDISTGVRLERPSSGNQIELGGEDTSTTRSSEPGWQPHSARTKSGGFKPMATSAALAWAWTSRGK